MRLVQSEHLIVFLSIWIPDLENVIIIITTWYVVFHVCMSKTEQIHLKFLLVLECIGLKNKVVILEYIIKVIKCMITFFPYEHLQVNILDRYKLQYLK